MISFGAFPLWLNLVIFAGAALFVWAAGSRLAGYADEIARRTGLGQAFVGMLLLGVATSLPEIATTVTGAVIGNARLVASNLFGGVAMQMAILAVVDMVVVRGALTHFTPQPILLLQGVMLLLLLAVALAGVATGEPLSIFGVGLTPFLLLAGYGITLRMAQRKKLAPRWRATNEPEPRQTESRADERWERTSSAQLYWRCGLAGLVILAAGWALALAGDALAGQTGLGASFVGVALVAVSTSLPEVSTTLEAARRGNYEMAVSNILGTNCLEVALFFLADLCYREGAILAAVDRSALFAAALGMVVTCLFLVGLLERRDRTVLGMGVDSLLVLVVYLAGLGVLYFLK